MAEVKWIKITTNIFDDEKIKLIDTMPDRDTLLVIWFKLLAMAGKTNDNGLVYVIKEMPTTDEMLATIFNRPLNTVRMALDIFSKFGMIEINQHVNIVNWEKHQNIDGLEKIREQNRLRQEKYKAKKKQQLLELKSNVTNNVIDNVTTTLSNETDIDIEKEEEKDIKMDNNVRQSILNLKELLEVQFDNKFTSTQIDKLVILSVQYEVNPLEIYNNSDYLRGFVDKKPTWRMWTANAETTIQKMKAGEYVNKDLKQDKQLDPKTEFFTKYKKSISVLEVAYNNNKLTGDQLVWAEEMLRGEGRI